MKTSLDNLANQQFMLNYEHFCDLHIFLGFAYIFPLLESMHALIKFAQSRDVFVCDLVATIRFVKMMFITCTIMKLSSSLLIAFGLSNHYWSLSMHVDASLLWLL
jgi:hypothetical protein